tara:strand:+ start:47 stop:247 length:201 start_codon:yes stop_codon:yes gene_type:complete
MKRRYIYDEIFDEIIEFANKNKLKWESPNGTDNFPFYLEMRKNMGQVVLQHESRMGECHNMHSCFQ